MIRELDFINFANHSLAALIPLSHSTATLHLPLKDCEEGDGGKEQTCPLNNTPKSSKADRSGDSTDKRIPMMASNGEGSRGMLKQPPISVKAAAGKTAVAAPKAITAFKMMMKPSSAILKDAVTGSKSSVNNTAADKSKQNNGGRGKSTLPSDKILAMLAKLPRIPVKRENHSAKAKLAVVEIVAECGSVEGAVNIFKRQKVVGYQHISWQSASRWVTQSAKVQRVLFVF